MLRVSVVVAWIFVGSIMFLSTVAEAFAFVDTLTAGSRRRRTSLYDVITPQDSNSSCIPTNAFSALDLAPFINHLKSYACTKRGEQSIVALIPATSSLEERRRDGRKASLFGSNRSSQRNHRFVATSRSTAQSTICDELHQVLPVATSVENAIQEYSLVGEAMDILHCQNDSAEEKVILPPMFQLIDGDTESDEDEWVELCMNNRLDAYQEIDLETILQAECLVKLLLDTYNWSSVDGADSYPGLVGVVTEMSTCVEHLSNLYSTLASAVEIKRTKASLSDGNFFMFQLASGSRFPELDSLRDKEEKLLLKIQNSKSADNDISNHRQLATIREELSILEQQTTNAMIASMIDAAPHVQRAQHVLARLDIIFARASYACEWGGVIPEVGNESIINVKEFVHPILAIEKSIRDVVPVDLLLPGQVLMISGPNAGGKTLSLKSFGLTACFVKLGIPITVVRNPSEDCKVRVDFFDEIFVQIGDNQNLIAGESTLMARLNACATLIQRAEKTDAAKLVLLDELGGGTDPFAGAALSTAILEKLCTDTRCKIVATTHSPQLKALSLDDERFQSASVLLESKEGDEKEQNNILDSAKMKPTFKLHYGFATESFPLGAASRCNPSLPDDVIRRAAELMSKGSDGDDTVEALRRHMIALEHERNSAKKLTEEAQAMFNEVAVYKLDMVDMLQSSESNLSRLEARLQNIYETLNNDKTRDSYSYELVGDGLSSLRLLRKAVKSQEELLREKGLRRVSDLHSFSDNESVVIVAEGEWQWQNAVVRINNSMDCSNNETITVAPSLDLEFGVDATSQTLLSVSRKDLAVWDMPNADWGFQDEYEYGSTSYSARKKSSSNVLEILKQVGDTKPVKARTVQTTEPSFTSARERKTAGKKSAAKEKKSKKKR